MEELQLALDKYISISDIFKNMYSLDECLQYRIFLDDSGMTGFVFLTLLMLKHSEVEI